MATLVSETGYTLSAFRPPGDHIDRDPTFPVYLGVGVRAKKVLGEETLALHAYTQNCKPGFKVGYDDETTWAAPPPFLEHQAPSGLPLGRKRMWVRWTGLVIRCDGEFETVTSKLEMDLKPGPTPPRPQIKDFEAHEPFLESLVRTALGGMVGIRLEPDGEADVGGRRVARYTCSRSGREFLDLEGWAAARGLALGPPDAVPCVSVTGGGRDVVLPLGSMQARVDGRWFELDDCVAEKDGRWLVPATLDGLVP